MNRESHIARMESLYRASEAAYRVALAACDAAAHDYYRKTHGVNSSEADAFNAAHAAKVAAYDRREAARRDWNDAFYTAPRLADVPEASPEALAADAALHPRWAAFVAGQATPLPSPEAVALRMAAEADALAESLAAAADALSLAAIHLDRSRVHMTGRTPAGGWSPVDVTRAAIAARTAAHAARYAVEHRPGQRG